MGAGFVYLASKLIYLKKTMAIPEIHGRFRYTLLVALVTAFVTYLASYL